MNKTHLLPIIHKVVSAKEKNNTADVILRWDIMKWQMTKDICWDFRWDGEVRTHHDTIWEKLPEEKILNI